MKTKQITIPQMDCKQMKIDQLVHAVEVAVEICRTMAEPTHCLHNTLKEEGPERWAQWRDFFISKLQKTS